MKLSEAIRLEGMTLEQSVGESSDVTRSACALQGAALMVGRSAMRWGQSIKAEWPWTSMVRPGCPVCGAHGPSGLGIIIHLNDEHCWTRNQIADWVETIEPDEGQRENKAAGVYGEEMKL